MRRSREIILDFTSLLDVVMVILFFFILFSHFETVEARKELEAAQQAVIEEYNGKMEEAEMSLAEADRLLAEIGQADARKAENIDAISAFGKGENLKIRLRMTDGSWKIIAYKGEAMIAEIENDDTDKMKKQLFRALAESRITIEDTILCDFIYNPEEAGTAAAYKQVTKLLSLVKNEYLHFYYSEVDMSIGNEV